MSFDTRVIWQNLPALAAGIWLTVAVVAVSLAVGILIGMLVCAGRLLARGFAYYLSVYYVALFRGLPEPIIIFWLYYCAPFILNTKLSAFTTGTVALAIPTGAYLGEIFRAGIQAVPRGQIEAARAVGLSPLWLVLDVVAPQALRMMIPPMLGIVTILIKNSALVSAIGIEELFYRATVLGGQTFRYFEFLTVAALIYFLLIMPLSALAQRQERRLARKLA
jgi:His/Glu/Gln/Arg/opine family amino acid ABC transporter permease subunit